MIERLKERYRALEMDEMSIERGPFRIWASVSTAARIGYLEFQAHLYPRAAVLSLNLDGRRPVITITKTK